MARKAKTQIEKIEKVLINHNTGPGITAAAVSKMTRVPRDIVYARISDLRKVYTIHSNYRQVNGKRKVFYRLAG